MSGVTWDERQPGDWLASNGRWYPQNKYPRGWDTLALPPAPDHGSIAKIHGRIAERGVSGAAEPPSGAPRTSRVSGRPAPPTPPRGAPPATPPPSAAPARSAPTGRQVADAEASNVRTYKYRLDPGAEPPMGLPPAEELPPPPGRLAPIPGDAKPAAPRPTTSDSKNAASAASALAGVSIFGNDLDGVIGKARKRIEEAIEESADGDNWE